MSRRSLRARSIDVIGLQLAAHFDPDLQELLNRHHSAISKLSEVGQSVEPVGATEGIAKFISSLERGESTKIPTGFPGLDRLLKGGVEPGRQYGIGAATSIGKSTVSVNIGTNIAKRDHVMLFSLEMSSAECYERIAQSVASESIDKMSSQIGSGNTSSLSSKLNSVANLKFAVDDRSRTLAGIQAQARRAARKYGTRIVIVDYVQLVDPPDKKIPRHEQIGVMTRAFKA